MSSSGFILCHRSLLDHWIADDNERFAVWIKMLMLVNHKPKKVMIKGQLIECGRGESLMSVAGWAKALNTNWDRNKMNRFFKLLEGEHMIALKNEHVTTRLTICNYDKYQVTSKENRTASDAAERTPNEQCANSKRAVDDAQTKNAKERVKNDKAIKTDAALDIFGFWKTTFGKQDNTHFTAKRKKAVLGRLAEYSAEEIKQAIVNCSQSSFHTGDNKQGVKYTDLELICRNDDNLEKFRDLTPSPNRINGNNSPAAGLRTA